MFEHQLSTPIIALAADGHNARGVWASPGHVAYNHRAYWDWGRYGVDFCKENGAWKIRHLHIYATFLTPYDTEWTKTATCSAMPEDSVTNPLRGNKPGTASWASTGSDTPANLPLPPEPYRSFDEAHSY